MKHTDETFESLVQLACNNPDGLLSLRFETARDVVGEIVRRDLLTLADLTDRILSTGHTGWLMLEMLNRAIERNKTNMEFGAVGVRLFEKLRGEQDLLEIFERTECRRIVDLFNKVDLFGYLLLNYRNALDPDLPLFRDLTGDLHWRATIEGYLNRRIAKPDYKRAWDATLHAFRGISAPDSSDPESGSISLYNLTGYADPYERSGGHSRYAYGVSVETLGVLASLVFRAMVDDDLMRPIADKSDLYVEDFQVLAVRYPAPRRDNGVIARPSIVRTASAASSCAYHFVQEDRGRSQRPRFLMRPEGVMILRIGSYFAVKKSEKKRARWIAACKARGVDHQALEQEAGLV